MHIHIDKLTVNSIDLNILAHIHLYLHYTRRLQSVFVCTILSTTQAVQQKNVCTSKVLEERKNYKNKMHKLYINLNVSQIKTHR